ncbi:hypothetical protein B0H14DRAFT_2691405, partial [Mycena olivaceomarginata]
MRVSVVPKNATPKTALTQNPPKHPSPSASRKLAPARERHRLDTRHRSPLSLSPFAPDEALRFSRGGELRSSRSRLGFSRSPLRGLRSPAPALLRALRSRSRGGRRRGGGRGRARARAALARRALAPERRGVRVRLGEVLLLVPVVGGRGRGAREGRLGAARGRARGGVCGGGGGGV